MTSAYATNTLQYDRGKCSGCGMCGTVCPHGVFAMTGRLAELVSSEDCIECGACALNCPTGAISVESGVGCASALIIAALTGKEEATCGCCGEGEDTCCGG